MGLSLEQIPLAEQVAAVLAEDIGTGDLTAALIPESAQAEATVTCRESGVLCGRPWFDEVFRQLDAGITVDWSAAEGEAIAAEQLLCTLRGPARAILSGERAALNFLQTLSGTAAATARYVAAVAGTGVAILDTRKTLPGLRLAQKYAVAQGGGRNHRIGLYDMVLIKENHILAAGSIAAAVATARNSVAADIQVEVEVENLDEVREALEAGADILLLDNMDNATLRQAAAMNAEFGGRAKLEASGGVSLESVRAIAETGVDYISIGALTKDVKALDLSMRFQPSS